MKNDNKEDNIKISGPNVDKFKDFEKSNKNTKKNLILKSDSDNEKINENIFINNNPD